MIKQIKSHRYALWAIILGLVLLGISLLSQTDAPAPSQSTVNSQDDFFVDDGVAPMPSKKQLAVSASMVDVMMEAALKENPSLRENEFDVRVEFQKSLVAQEMMVAEAIEVGLAATDPIARNRLSGLIILSIYQQADTGITDEAVKEFYETNRQKYTMPEKRKVQHLFVSVTNVTDDEKAKTILSEKFIEAVKPEAEMSDVVAAAINPRWISLGELRLSFGPSFANWIFGLEVGRWSEPHRSSSGWHRVKVMEHAPEHIRPFEEVQAETEADLRQTLRMRAYQAEMDRLALKYEVRIDP